ncbi:LysR family transcriptional regulator [Streptomyces lasiicapitis]|uniref:LysR family transcriptional regulator n=2 Tax=Streptomyces lasiicapitis TaxID=1923961 RepID=A0ABQ2MNV4_9ACTN|nr:LysR family transcriptional regulator [Streptomyces lasiicapitis]GGO55267.1 LysR family transcriptional regulator [Streptomyces lasiicapitis]
MLDLARLRALHAVAVHGTVGAAADALGYTPSAVSQQIAKLERETRTKLLERQGRGVALTDEAVRLADAARELLAIVERAETDLEERRGVPAGRLTVVAFASAARGLLPGTLAELARRHPALDARLTEVEPHLSVDLVAKGAADLAVAHDWDIAPLPAPPGVEQAVIGEDLCDLLVPAGHRLAGRKSVRRAELRDERWISQPPGRVCHDWLVRTMRAAGCEPDIVHQAEENPTLIALVAAGLGIALLPRLGRGPLPAGVVAVQLDPLPARRLYAVWRTGAARRPAIAEAVRVLRETWDTVTAADDTTVTPAADTAVTATADKPVGAAAGPPPLMS